MVKRFLMVTVFGTGFTWFPSMASLPAMASTLVGSFTSSLAGNQEVVTNDDGSFTPIDTGSEATGTASLELFDEGGGEFSLGYSLNIVSDELNFALVNSGATVEEILATGENNNVTQLHIHNGSRGANGPVVYGIFNPDQDVNDNVNLSSNGNTTTISGSWDPGDGGVPLNEFVPLLLGATEGEDVPLYWNLHTVAFPGGEIRGQILASDVAAETVPEPTNLIGLALMGISATVAYRRRLTTRLG